MSIPTDWADTLKTITGWINDRPEHADGVPLIQSPPPPSLDTACTAAIVALAMRETGYAPPDHCTATEGVVELVLFGEGESYVTLRIDEWGYRVLAFDTLGTVACVSLSHPITEGIWPIDNLWPKVGNPTPASP